jgi:hypothetical protein
MKTYIVTLDVADDSRRSQMTNHLRSYGFYCPIHDNCWAVKVNKTATEVRDDLMKLQQPGDRIFVVRSGTEAAWNTTYGEQNADWLKEHL